MSPTRRTVPRPHPNGQAELGYPVEWELAEPAPQHERAWVALGCGLCLLSAVFAGLGVWKAIELVGNAT